MRAGDVSSAVRLRNLTVSYRQHQALRHLSGVFVCGSLTAIMGPNGSGKSTLLKSMAGVLPAGARYAKGCGVDVRLPRRQVAYLPQQSELDRAFPIDVRDCVLLGLWGDTGAWGGVTPDMLIRVQEALRIVGLQGFERRQVGSLSVGQLQRVLFARLLVQDARLILLDEPFNAVDSKTTAGLLALVRHWHAQGRTVIAVLHDEAQVRANFPQTLLLARELIGWGETSTVLNEANLLRARVMAEAWDDDTVICGVDSSVL